MEESPGTQYQAWIRLAEQPEAPWSEMEVQRLWFEEAYRPQLVTTEGECIEILQPGYWNHGSGPDFSHASLRNGCGEVEHGAVEIHLRPEDWRQHRHEDDKSYDPVILHVVWQCGPRPFFPRTSRHGRVRQVELSSQLRLPLDQARRLCATTPAEQAVGARLGKCHAALQAMDDAAVLALLREAGWYRFHQRVARMRARAALAGREQALWQGLADALGYASNRAAFGWLARRVPCARAQAVASDLEREALLYGNAGLLPARRIDSADAWARQVWDCWWKLRGQEEGACLPKGRWSLRGQRPANRPERRLAVLALLGAPTRWCSFAAAARRADGPALEAQLAGLEHPYWSRHFTWTGAAQPRPTALVGACRAASFLYNTVWPLAWDEKPELVCRALEEARAPLETHPERIAAFRLLGGRRLRGQASRLLVREGLIQIYQDFCLREGTLCTTCDFPALLAKGRPG